MPPVLDLLPELQADWVASEGGQVPNGRAEQNWHGQAQYSYSPT